MTIGLFIFLVVLAMSLAGVVIICWIAASACRWAVNLFAGDRSPPAAVEVARCRNAGCRSTNPPHARFCRRCGTANAYAARPVAPRREPIAA